MPRALSRRMFLARGSAVAGVASLTAMLGACSDGGDGATPSTTTGPGRESTPFRYGDDPSQVGDLWLPSRGTTTGSVGVVVLLHGGYWRAAYDRSLMAPLARDVVRRGWAAWNVDYRPSQERGGGWPGTFTDVAEGIDALATRAARSRLDLARVVFVGHSAGGCMALWAAARKGLPARAPGAGPKVEAALAVSLAGVNNLVAAVFEDLGQGAVVALMGAEPEGPDDRYLLASPVERLPIGVPQLLVHGADDPIVPVEQSSAYVAKARKLKDPAELVTVANADHFDVIDPAREAWRETAERIAKVLDA